jgi:AraC family transcriptional regulator
MQAAIAPSALRRLPPDMQDVVIHRGEWSFCAMEHSSMGAVQIADPGAPFHHLGLTIGAGLVRVGMSGDGRPLSASLGQGDMALIEAGVGGSTWWDTPYESACFYFTDDALSVALGCVVDRNSHALRTTLNFRSPVVRRLLKTLHADAVSGQPHGTLIGDAVFVALAGQLLAPQRRWVGRAQPGTPDWRVRRALEYIHAHLTRSLAIADIAAAAGTSPFHLNRQFRAGLGHSLWQYVLRERARLALDLMQDPRISLTEVSSASGFETYASFIDAMRRTFGALPSDLRRHPS